MLRLRGLTVLCAGSFIIFFILWKISTPYRPLIHASNAKSDLKVKKLNLSNTKPDDPLLIAEVRKEYLIPPADPKSQYVLKHPEVKDPSAGQANIIRKALKEMRNGFFVECGAVDGEMLSNTLILEKELGWTGLLLEADPMNVKEMLKVNRKAWVAPTCLSTSSNPVVINFRTFQGVDPKGLSEAWGRIPGSHSGYAKEGVLETDLKLQCIPLYTFLLALNRTTIDFLSLDVEGAEYSIITTIPWNKIKIRTIAIEHMWITQGKDVLFKYVLDQGYNLISNYTNGNFAADFIFIRKDEH